VQILTFLGTFRYCFNKQWIRNIDTVYDKFRRVEEKVNKVCNSAPQENKVNTKETFFWIQELDNTMQLFCTKPQILLKNGLGNFKDYCKWHCSFVCCLVWE
jgi:DNA-binding transcriptional regulator GbsR (MarR family)